jgi:hypothetical protein
VVNGAPRSEVNTNGDFGSCSRWGRRKARNSSPRIGCVLGVPFLTLRMARAAVLKSFCSQGPSTQPHASRAGRPQAHCSVAMSPAVDLRGLCQLGDLGVGEILAGPQLGIHFPASALLMATERFIPPRRHVATKRALHWSATLLSCLRRVMLPKRRTRPGGAIREPVKEAGECIPAAEAVDRLGRVRCFWRAWLAARVASSAAP